MTSGMPSYSAVMKSREVEDPVNWYLNRPLAYGITWLLYRTPVTPNAVTFASLFAGIASGVGFFQGTPSALLFGGLMLWVSSVLDCVDGVLARAKNMQSQFGRALDGTSDMIVGAVTVLGAFFHIWEKNHSMVELVAMIPAAVSANLHLSTYDYYKESWLRMTRLDKGGEGDDAEELKGKIEDARRLGMLAYVTTKHVLVPYLETQQDFIRSINPRSLRSGAKIVPTSESAAAYARLNGLSMRLLTYISLAPHCLLMGLAGAFDRLEWYLWIRLVLMNVLFVAAVWMQRRATDATLAEFERLGVVPHEVAS